MADNKNIPIFSYLHQNYKFLTKDATKAIMLIKITAYEVSNYL